MDVKKRKVIKLSTKEAIFIIIRDGGSRGVFWGVNSPPPSKKTLIILTYGDNVEKENDLFFYTLFFDSYAYRACTTRPLSNNF